MSPKKPSLKVLIADKLAPAVTSIFHSRGIEVTQELGLAGEAFAARLREVDGVVIRSAVTIDADVLKAMGPDAKLAVIGRAGIGVDNIDLNQASHQGIIVLNTPFGNAVTTAEHAISLLLAAARHIAGASSLLHTGKWGKSAFKGTELMGKTLGVVGAGNIGALVIERALGLQMKVIIYDPFITEKRATELHARKVSWEELTEAADAITFHVPLTDKTRHILDSEALARTKPGVIIVNCARGGIVDETALKAGLESGHIGAAALDVFEKEPLGEDHALKNLPRLTLTPHLGASTQEAQERVGIQIAEQISDFLLTGELRHAVNTFSLSASEHQEILPYTTLAEDLASFIAAMLESAIESIKITLIGEAAALKEEPLLASAICGLYKKSMESINKINAISIAKNQGVHTELIKSDEESLYHSLLQLDVKTEKYTYHIAGTILGGQSRVVRLQNSTISAELDRHHLYVINEDKPGFIRSIAGILSDADINIISFHLASAKKDSTEGQAAALITINAPITSELLQAIKALPLVIKATYVPIMRV